jgi:hypothetical protein
VDYQLRCDTIVIDYVRQGEQQVTHTKTIKAIRQAIEGYLNWMERHAQGTRGLTRFSHWYHGDSGVRRAHALLAIVLQNLGCDAKSTKNLLMTN